MSPLISAIVLGAALQAAAAGDPPHSITAQLTGASTLRLCLINNSDIEDHLVEEMLPWSNRYSITLVATRAGGYGTELLVQPLVTEHGFRG